MQLNVDLDMQSCLLVLLKLSLQVMDIGSIEKSLKTCR